MSEKLNGLDLFSGIGGISLGLQPWVKTVAYCEQDRYAQAVLLSRMQSGELDRAPIWDDVRTLHSEMLPKIDIIFGGFPCQDISVAGKGAGLAGERSGLFFEIVRLVDECQPTFVFLENVPAIRTRGLNTVAESFAVRGYDFIWTVLSAAEVGAPHLRKRWFALAAHSNGINGRNQWKKEMLKDWKVDQRDFESDVNGSAGTVADALCKGLEGQRKPSRRAKKHADSSLSSWWKTEPDVGRVVDGVSFRVDRLRCLGNAVVPMQARTAFKRLCEGFI